MQSFGPNASIVLNIRNTHVGDEVVEVMVGRHGMPGRNENGERYLQVYINETRQWKGVGYFFLLMFLYVFFCSLQHLPIIIVGNLATTRSCWATVSVNQLLPTFHQVHLCVVSPSPGPILQNSKACFHFHFHLHNSG